MGKGGNKIDNLKRYMVEKDISEPSEVMDTKRPPKPKLQKPSPPPPEPKPPAIAKEMNGSTISDVYQRLIKKKDFGHWDKQHHR